jgi:hypothetical protein
VSLLEDTAESTTRPVALIQDYSQIFQYEHPILGVHMIVTKILRSFTKWREVLQEENLHITFIFHHNFRNRDQTLITSNMSPSNHAVLFAYKIPLSSQVGSLPKPAFVPLRVDHDVSNTYSPSTVTDSSGGWVGENNPLMHRPQPSDMPMNVGGGWGEPTAKGASASLLSHIPQDKDFSEVLSSIQSTEKLAYATVYWSEAEILYMRHRALN